MRGATLLSPFVNISHKLSADSFQRHFIVVCISHYTLYRELFLKNQVTLLWLVDLLIHIAKQCIPNRGDLTQIAQIWKAACLLLATELLATEVYPENKLLMRYVASRHFDFTIARMRLHS